jgi:hypothetical protein
MVCSKLVAAQSHSFFGRLSAKRLAGGPRESGYPQQTERGDRS